LRLCLSVKGFFSKKPHSSRAVSHSATAVLQVYEKFLTYAKKEHFKKVINKNVKKWVKVEESG